MSPTKFKDQDNRTPKYSVSVVDQYVGFMDYYQGHGHATLSDNNVVACLTVQTSVNYKETCQELADSLIEESAVEEFHFLTKDKDFKREIADQWDELITSAIKEEVIGKLDPTEKAFDLDPIDEESEETPYCLLTLHVYKEPEK